MATNTSILLGDYFDGFISNQIKSERFSSAREVVRAALRLFKQEKKLKEELVSELQIGEQSGFIKQIDKERFISELHKRYPNN